MQISCVFLLFNSTQQMYSFQNQLNRVPTAVHIGITCAYFLLFVTKKKIEPDFLVVTVLYVFCVTGFCALMLGSFTVN